MSSLALSLIRVDGALRPGELRRGPVMSAPYLIAGGPLADAEAHAERCDLVTRAVYAACSILTDIPGLTMGNVLDGILTAYVNLALDELGLDATRCALEMTLDNLPRIYAATVAQRAMSAGKTAGSA